MELVSEEEQVGAMTGGFGLQVWRAVGGSCGRLVYSLFVKRLLIVSLSNCTRIESLLMKTFFLCQYAENTI